GENGRERPRIAVPVQLVFGVLIASYVLAMSVIGGAELARYMLPVLPLVIIVCISTLWRRVRYWVPVTALVAIAFVTALFINPPYGFPFEDNLAYQNYALLHRNAAEFLAKRYATARVLTAWPASDELTRPYLGYVNRPMRVLRIENFALDELSAAAEVRGDFDVALLFSTKYVPARSLLARWPAWERLQTRFFGFHRDVPPPVAAQILGGDLVYAATHDGQWVGVIEMQRVLNARTLNRHEVAGMGLDDQPHVASGLQMK
ncbi:MAG TPA: glycosyltransferase, partial [Terriglobales bacterium]